MMKAAIDIGTNTVRLLIAEMSPDPASPFGWRYKPVYAEQHITRLGQGVGETGRLTPEAIGRTIAVLTGFRDRILRYGSMETAAAATSAVREAQNRKEFLDRARTEAGIEVEVISGEEEARRTAIGVLCGVPGAMRQAVIMDIGGGSTEFIRIKNGRFDGLCSTPLGTVRLTERCIAHDPPTPDEISEIRQQIEAELEAVDPLIQREASTGFAGASAGRGGIFVGTAGTVTTLAAMDLELEEYRPEIVHGYELSRERLNRIMNTVSKLNLPDRKRLPGLEPDRADVIVAGAVLVFCVLTRYNVARLTVSDTGLREGLLMTKRTSALLR
jgi:exopolyphosphatase/guanosine-5'-triphosphate,3'-diphosphate pyrophosphatase